MLFFFVTNNDYHVFCTSTYVVVWAGMKGDGLGCRTAALLYPYIGLYQVYCSMCEDEMVFLSPFIFFINFSSDFSYRGIYGNM